jgi:cytochrome c oxidase subunit 1
MSAKDNFIAKLRGLDAADNKILRTLIFFALLTLGLGVLYALFVVLARAGFISLPGLLGYQLLTLHGTTIFYYWLYFMQAALLLAFILIYTKGSEKLSWRSFAWLGTGLMILGFVLNQFAPLTGAAVLYDAPTPLSADFPTSGYFYLGYVCLGLGLLFVTLSGLATAIRAKLKGHVENWNTITFASVILGGLLIVSSLAALNVFVPATLWAFGLQPLNFNYDMAYHVLFHNLHYLPLLSTVLVWYVLIEVMTGVKSIFGEWFSKLIFSIYLIVVPPTSLYHMFLSPSLPPEVKTAGSILSLFINIPTILVFLLIVASLEASARAAGARGIFGWLKTMPWKNPAFTAISMAVLCAAAGGALASVLIQGETAKLISDTFFVPAYFHFFTVGTVSLTFIALLMYLVPAIFGSNLYKPKSFRRESILLTIGVYLFGTAGILAGLMGVPRRTFGITYNGLEPNGWAFLMAFVGIGGIIMAAALLQLVIPLIVGMFAKIKKGEEVGSLATVAIGSENAKAQQAWLGPVCFMILLAAMFALTAVAFQQMGSLPIQGG